MKNTSFETELETFTTSDPDNMTREYSSQNVHTGNRALKVSNLTAGGSIEQDVVVPKGNYYTFSGYFQNLEPITVRLSYASEDGTVKVEEAFKSTNEYERNDITIYYAENATSDLRITISFSSVNVMYLDDVQLEKGEVANAYNIIENSDFADGLSDWALAFLNHRLTYSKMYVYQGTRIFSRVLYT